MKKLIFSFLILLVSAGIASAQAPLNSTYYGTATNVYMNGGPASDIAVTTVFINNVMDDIDLHVSFPIHDFVFTTKPAFTYDSGLEEYIWNSNGTGTIRITPPGTLYNFEVNYITDVKFNSSGKLTYYFEAYVDQGVGTISFSFTED
jgi:hypothetical protein